MAKLDSIDKKRLWAIVDSVIHQVDSSASKELTNEYKKRMVTVLKQVFDEVTETFEDQDALLDHIKEFAQRRQDGKRTAPEGYLLVNVPVVLPIELAGLFYITGPHTMVSDIVDIQEGFGKSAFKEFMKAGQAVALDRAVDKVSTEALSQFVTTAVGKKQIN